MGLAEVFERFEEEIVATTRISLLEELKDSIPDDESQKIISEKYENELDAYMNRSR